MIYVVPLVMFVALVVFALYSDKRSATQVLDDLSRDESDELVSPDKQKQNKLKKIVAFLGAVLVLGAAHAVMGIALPNLIVGSIMMMGIGYIVHSNKQKSKALKITKNIEYQLPLVMEQLVMAVQSGYDVFSALRIVLEAEYDAKAKKRSPLSDLLLKTKTLIESGVTVEDALKEVSQEVPSPALRHAFVHLAIAHKEGGELVKPLRELSDATQLYYQETVEEDIAKLPVKATLPLVITFAGLLTIFLTAPLIEMQNMATKSQGVLQNKR